MSTIKTDTLTGTSTAGSIVVTGEGNSTTTNLQQGLAKHWILLNGTGTIAVTDSFNNTSITDNGTGDYTITIANNMGNITYSAVGGGGYDEDGTTANNRQGPGTSNKTATAFKLTTGSNTTAADDWESPTVQTLGDLA
jgi:hypothetical protein